jgi:hypothetical protein
VHAQVLRDLSKGDASDERFRLEYEKLFKAFQRSQGKAVQNKVIASAALGGRD